jgi:hypothetical protein
MMTIQFQKRNTTPNHHRYPIGHAYADKNTTKPSMIRGNGGPPKGDGNTRPL